MKRSTATELFEKNVVRNEVGCWGWTGSKSDSGYGLIGVRPRPIRAHRFSYEQAVGPIPEGAVICHHCDNPPCSRPDHLFASDQRGNSMDAAMKGRLGRKLTPHDVAWARNEFRTTMKTQAEIGEQLGVKNSSVWAAISGKTFAWVDAPTASGRRHRKDLIGSRNPSSKLSVDDVREVRRLAASGVSGAEIARRYSVTKGAIYHILRGRAWAHTQEEVA